MKYIRKVGSYASIGLTLSLFVGCGGGGSGGGTPSSSLVELSPETSRLMAKNASDALPGCTFTTAASKVVIAARPERNISAELFAEATRQIKIAKLKMLKNIVLKAGNLSAREDINKEFSGTCPSSPGNYTIVGTHDNGVDDGEMSFNAFCIGSSEEYFVINGKVKSKSVGTPSPSGPIPQSLEMSTNAGGLEITEKSSEGTFNHLVKVEGFKFTYGNGDDSPTKSKPDHVVANSIIIRDGRKNNEFNVANVDATSYVSGDDKVLIVNGLTYKDPDSGMVKISSTPLIIDDDGVLKSGTVTAEGANSSSLVLSPKATGNNILTVTAEGEDIGDMNCTEFGGVNPLF